MDDLNICFYCGSDEPFTVNEIFPDLREFDALFCCEGQREDITTYLETLTDAEWNKAWRDFFKQWDREWGGPLKSRDLKVRGVGRFDSLLDYQPKTKLTVAFLDKPGDQTMAKEFIRQYHRHCPKAPAGWRFGLGCYADGELIAVAWVGRPVARGINHRKVCEVNRLCTRTDLHPDLTLNSSSMLYAAAAREVERRGFTHVITYTLESESGKSVEAAGFEWQYDTAAGKTWNCESRPREQAAPTCAKDCWAKELDPLRHEHNRRHERMRWAALATIIQHLDLTTTEQTHPAVFQASSQPAQPALF